MIKIIGNSTKWCNLIEQWTIKSVISYSYLNIYSFRFGKKVITEWNKFYSRQTSTFIVQFCSYSRWIQLSSCSIWIQVQCSDLHLSSTMQWDDKQIFWKMILSFRLVAFILFYFILCPHFKIISKKEVECNSYSLSNRNNAFTFA